MLEIRLKEKDTLDHLIKWYKQKLDQTKFLRERKKKSFFESASQKRKIMKQKAVLRERYKRTHGLV